MINKMFLEFAEFTSAVNGKRLRIKKSEVHVVFETGGEVEDPKHPGKMLTLPDLTHITIKGGQFYPIKETYDEAVKRLD